MKRKVPLLLAIAIVVIPFGFVWAYSRLPDRISPAIRSLPLTRATEISGRFRQVSHVDFEEDRPRVTNINIVDLDQDGSNDLLVCDAVRNTVWWVKGDSSGSPPEMWPRQPLVPVNSIPAPCHTSLADIDQDGDQDILVAVLQSVWPTDVRLGQVIALLNDGRQNFSSVVIANDLRRVTDVQPADFDNDGDLDLAVAEFGYLHGRVLWLENLGDLRFADHTLLARAGSIHTPTGDFDGDGDIDIAAVVSQNHEEVWIFENRSEASDRFEGRIVWSTSNYDVGFAGMTKCDLDADGDTDFLLSSGDNLELAYPCPQPHHGCLWMENLGGLKFETRAIGHFAGTYAAEASDVDGDGDQDVVLASMFNDWKTEGTTSLAWLENDGHQQFELHGISTSPTHLCCLACGDLNGDTVPEIIAGRLQIFSPYGNNRTGLAIWNQDSGGGPGQ